MKRATVHDVAREAGVSLATVDRVLNCRPGVRKATIDKVEAAIDALDFRRDIGASLLARARDIRVQVILPEGGNPFMDHLAEAVDAQRRAALAERLHVTAERVPPLDSTALAAALDRLRPDNCDCAIIVATDDAHTRAAVAEAEARGVAVMTLVSDIEGSARRRFIGIDNRAAGRTAASLLGRFLPQGGRVGLVLGSMGLRDHRDRCEAFSELVAAEFPRLGLAGPVEGYDRVASTRDAVAGLLQRYPDLDGLYSIGAGNAGLVAALHECGRAGSIRVVAHELGPESRAALRDGTIDVVLDQNPEGEVRLALAEARRLALNGNSGADLPPIEIRVFLRDNLT